MPLLAANKEALLDLLRTNNADNFLQRRSNNQYVAALHELLNVLGYSKELQYDRNPHHSFYGDETIQAIRAFASRNRAQSDGMGVSPVLLHLMLQRYAAIEGLLLLQRALANQDLSAAFNLEDPENFGTRQLNVLLENLDIFEEDVRFGINVYARQKGQPSTYQLTVPIARSILEDLKPCYGQGLQFTENPTNPGPTEPIPGRIIAELDIVIAPDFVAVSDGTIQVRFKKHSPIGLSTGGSHSITRFINDYAGQLASLELSPSAIAVMKAVSLNEGSFDSINTYDKGFLSIGIFQWTLGQDNRMGELPALLKKIKSFYPGTFQTFFGAYDLDVSVDTNTTYGYLTHRGVPMGMPLQKDMFREPSYAFRFWRAAQEPDVQAVQVEHALSRLKNFYWKDTYTAMGFTLNKLITSSYGVALLLDNHVNRPSWVAKCVEQAMLNTGLTTNPMFWTDQEESTLINAYLSVRETYTENTTSAMTSAGRRAEKMYEGVRQGWLSTERGSFQMGTADLAIRSSVLMPLSYEAPSSAAAASKEVPPPPFYSPSDYPDIIMEIND
jgi:hypothetical protein